MIRIHPDLDLSYSCPQCNHSLKARSIYIPGMRCLAAITCDRCKASYYADLPAGHGLMYPMIVEANTGKIFDLNNVEWFAEWLRVSFQNKKSQPPPIHVEVSKPVRKALLLNCLDKLYGHSLLKLLNAQYYLDHYPGFDLVLLIQPAMRWLVPDGAAEVWTVELPFSRALEWNDGLADEIQKRMQKWEECWLSIARSHPHPTNFQIQRFSRIQPFPIHEWTARVKTKPVVTFIWREDRCWEENGSSKINLIRRDPVEQQRRLVKELFAYLKANHKTIDFAVAGLGEEREFPAMTTNLVTPKMDDEREKLLCRRYAESHVVVGVHGSNMLLPSAHAGSVVEILPGDRWYNLIQDLLPAEQDARLALCRYRILPMPVNPVKVAECVSSLLLDLPYSFFNFSKESANDFSPDEPWKLSRRRRELS